MYALRAGAKERLLGIINESQLSFSGVRDEEPRTRYPTDTWLVETNGILRSEDFATQKLVILTHSASLSL